MRHLAGKQAGGEEYLLHLIHGEAKNILARTNNKMAFFSFMLIDLVHTKYNSMMVQILTSSVYVFCLLTCKDDPSNVPVSQSLCFLNTNYETGRMRPGPGLFPTSLLMHYARRWLTKRLLLLF
jgi:hypothetical protein